MREKKALKEVAHHQRASFNISRGVNEFSFPTLPPPRHPSLNETNSNFKWCWSARCSFWVLFEGKRLGLDQIHLPLIDGLSVKCVLVLDKTFLFFIRFCWILVKLLVLQIDILQHRQVSTKSDEKQKCLICSTNTFNGQSVF